MLSDVTSELDGEAAKLCVVVEIGHRREHHTECVNQRRCLVARGAIGGGRAHRVEHVIDQSLDVRR